MKLSATLGLLPAAFAEALNCAVEKLRCSLSAANNKNVTMRVMDFYHHDEGKIRENWVPIDIAHILKQIDIDVFDIIKNL